MALVEVLERGVAVPAIRVAPRAQREQAHTRGVEVQRAVTVRDGLVVLHLREQFAGPVGVELRVVRFEADGLV